MEWIQVITLFLANAGLILWMRAESRSDWRQMDAKLDEFKTEMRSEMRDFHGRLCVLEERFINWLIKDK